MKTGESKILFIIKPKPINANVFSVVISPDGRWVAAGSLDAIVRIWEAQTGNLVERLRGHEFGVFSVAFTPDGRGVVSGSGDKNTKYWDIVPMIDAVDAGNRSGLEVSLRQNDVNASATAPVPRGETDGWGEMGSICVTSTRHEVSHFSGDMILKL